MQDIGASKGAAGRPESVSYSQYLQQHQQPGELDHLKPLDSRAVQNGEADAPTSWYQRISIWMINEGTFEMATEMKDKEKKRRDDWATVFIMPTPAGECKLNECEQAGEVMEVMESPALFCPPFPSLLFS